MCSTMVSIRHVFEILFNNNCNQTLYYQDYINNKPQMGVQNKTQFSALHPYFQIPNVDSGLIFLNSQGVVQSAEIGRKWTFKLEK